MTESGLESSFGPPLSPRDARFDVMVAKSCIGDVLTGLGAAGVGGLGVAPSASIHPGSAILIEPLPGSASDMVGRNLANPLAAILSVGQRLHHLGHGSLKEAIFAAARD